MMDEFTVSWLSHWLVLSLAWLAGDEASMEELGFAGEAQRRAGHWQRGSSGIGQDQEENKSQPEPGSRQPTPGATCSEACTNMYVRISYIRWPRTSQRRDWLTYLEPGPGHAKGTIYTPSPSRSCWCCLMFDSNPSANFCHPPPKQSHSVPPSRWPRPADMRVRST
jgi:hypothetical protein